MRSTTLQAAVMGAAGILAGPALARAGIVLALPSETQPVPTCATDFVADLTFSTGGASSPLVGDEVAFTITGPATGLTITGVSSGEDRPANSVLPDEPSFFINTASAVPLYGTSDFLLFGSGLITDGSVLVQLIMHADAGTQGDYHVDFFTDPESAEGSLLYADHSFALVPDLTYSGATFSFVAAPEPASLAVLGAGMLLLAGRSRRRAG